MRYFLIILILIFALYIRLYRLVEIPGEWFGDISNVHEYVSQILRGEWPFYFFQSPGPLYHYVIAPFVLLTSYKGYETYKLASIIVGLFGILGAYLFVKELFSTRAALLTAWIFSFSFWPLVWSRLGNSQVVIPVILSFQLYFFVQYIKQRKIQNLILSAAISTFGWYTYPQTFIFPIIFLAGFLGFLWIRNAIRSKKTEIAGILILLIILTTPFFLIVKNQPENFGQGGYVGEKVLPLLFMNPGRLILGTAGNCIKTLGMFITHGDNIFRVNVSGDPIIDKLSFAFLLFGISYLLIRKRLIKLSYILLITCLLILPAIIPGVPQGEIPSSSRTIAIQPIIYMLISLGMLFILSLGVKRSKRIKSMLVILISLAGIFISFLNLNKYFVLYPKNLPDGNFAPGKNIAEYIDKNVNPSTSVYFASCCWGQAGEPEPKAVAYTIRKPRIYTGSANIFSCGNITTFPAMIVFSPHDEEKIEEYKQCFTNYSIQTVYSSGSRSLFTRMYIPKKIGVEGN